MNTIYNFDIEAETVQQIIRTDNSVFRICISLASSRRCFFSVRKDRFERYISTKMQI